MTPDYAAQLSLQQHGVRRFGDTMFVEPEFSAVLHVIRITNAVRKILKNKRPIFRAVRRGENHDVWIAQPVPSSRPGCSPGDQFAMALGADVDQIRHLFQIHRMHPYFDLFVKHTGHLRGERLGMHTVAAFNQAVEAMRMEASTLDFIKAKEEHERPVRKNYLGLVRYMRGLHRIYSKLLVIRIDLEYEVPHAKFGEVPPYVTFADVCGHRERFFRELRHSEIGEHLVGYAWCLHWGLNRGPHIHAMLFLDGQKVREDITIAQRLGERWKAIAGPTARYHSCNAQKDNYPHSGIGMVTHDDAEKIGWMEYAAGYVARADWHIRLLAPLTFTPSGSVKPAFRTFGRGVLPKGLPSGKGRPRKEVKPAAPKEPKPAKALKIPKVTEATKSEREIDEAFEAVRKAVERS
jgi:hypothetical protein